MGKFTERLLALRGIRDRRRFRNAWVLVDRPEIANDNAWHLFEFLRSSRIDINSWYVAAKGTPQWKVARKKYGKRVVPHLSASWARLMRECDVLLSSQRIPAIHSPPLPEGGRDGSKARRRFIYLGHGVHRGNNLQSLAREPIDLLICSTRAEYDQLTDPSSPQARTKKNTARSGLCRWDALREMKNVKNDDEKISIVLAPTWRSSLVRQPNPSTMVMEILDQKFLQSMWYRNWTELMRQLLTLFDESRDGTRLTVIPHPQMSEMTAFWPFDGTVDCDIVSYASPLIQQTLARADVVITDYSSISFDVAALGTSLIYFHFEAPGDVSNGHTRPGYFRYEEDGFGPIASTPEGVIELLRATRENNYLPDEIYQKRAQQAFDFFDGLACERTFRAIEDFLRNPLKDHPVPVPKSPGPE